MSGSRPQTSTQRFAEVLGSLKGFNAEAEQAAKDAAVIEAAARQAASQAAKRSASQLDYLDTQADFKARKVVGASTSASTQTILSVGSGGCRK